MSNKNNTCPVCGAGYVMRKENTVDCAKCGTKYAFAEYFSSEEVFATWNSVIQAAWNTYRKEQLKRLRSRTKLIVGPEYVAFHDADAAKVTIFDRFGKITTESNVRQYSVSNLHQVMLKTNGSITARGDNDAGQCRLTGIKDASFVQAAPYCTYLVNADGKVAAFGTCAIRDQIAQWTRIKELACGNSHLVGLTEHGTVLQVDSSAAGRSTRETALWKNVTAIAAASNHTVALHADGTVSYAGPKPEIQQEVSAWRNVISIAADSQYAVGLTEDGRVLLAGQCSAFLDGGRSDARNWENVVSIGADHGVIAAVNEEGELLLAGRFLYSDEVSTSFRRNNPAKL